MKRLKKENRAKLSKPMPKAALQKHPTKSFLTTIKSAYIMERLNDVFGILGWDIEHSVEDIIQLQDGRKYIVMKGRIHIKEADLYTPYQYGGHFLEGRNTEPADGYKSAVTDCLSKCASFLEIGIQIFKGNVNDQTFNESKIPDEVVEDKPETPKKAKKVEKELPKKEEPVMEEQEDEDVANLNVNKHGQMIGLVNQYTELFGKPPHWKMSNNSIGEEIRKKKEPVEDVGEETPTEEPHEKSDYSGEELALIEKVNEYKSSDELYEDAKNLLEIFKGFEQTTIDEDGFKAIINNQYMTLLNLEDNG